MQAYFGALVDKSISKQNSQLCNKIKKEFKKIFKKSTINTKEHNTFLFLRVKKSIEKTLEMETLEQIEHNLSSLLQEYYDTNKKKLKMLLKDKQELKETRP